MTKRIPVSTTRNNWHDAQRVDVHDMDTEQTSYLANDAAIVNNHLGSGIVPSSASQLVIFDSDELSATQAALLAAGDFDGYGLQSAVQPSDTVLGNQLEIELTDSAVFGRLSVKVLVIGLDFNEVPQYERFTFHRNEKQVGKKHYTRILAIFFNDFKGNNNCSRDQGGRITIKEAASYQLSRDAIMVAQDVEPNLFFRDFKVPNPSTTLFTTLQNGIGSEYSVDSLNINTTVKINRSLLQNDVTSKIGQKFQASTNNIQKITLLLGAGRDDLVSVENRFDWSGDIVISVYELQTTVNCPTDIVPELAIEFEPKAQPLTQLSFSQSELYDNGYVLTDVLQPIDFIFSATQLGSTTNPVIVPGRFYLVTINRSGAAGTGIINAGVGSDRTEDSRETLYNGSWVDVPEEDIWFQIWTAAAKIADGQAYDLGKGIEIDKTVTNEEGAEEDFCFDQQAFSDASENVLNIGIVQASNKESIEEQDERTGNSVNSREQYEPIFSFITESKLTELQETSEPLIIGCALDVNPKSNSLLIKEQTNPGLAKNDKFVIVNPDADLLSLRLIGSKLIPNINASKDYRIFKATLCTDGYGDVNGDGFIDSADVARANQLVGEGLFKTSTQQKINDGYISTLEILRADVDGDGYITSADVQLITNYTTRKIAGFPVGSSFTHLELQVQPSVGRYDGYFDCDGYIRLDGYTGQNIVSPSSLSSSELVYDGYLALSVINSDPAFTTIPFVEISYQVVPQPFWQDYLLSFSSDARLMPASFTSDESVEEHSCEIQTLFECNDRTIIEPECDPGRNDFYVPDNLLIDRGQILRPDGSFYPVDFEIGQVILQLPSDAIQDASINLVDKFIVDAGGGRTKAGFPAMKFADCSTVKSDALAKDQVRFGIAVQSFNIDGYTTTDGYSIDDIIGISMSHSTGILTMRVNHLVVDPIYMTLITKIEVTVYLKQAGWKNTPLVINPSEISGLLSA